MKPRKTKAIAVANICMSYYLVFIAGLEIGENGAYWLSPAISLLISIGCYWVGMTLLIDNRRPSMTHEWDFHNGSAIVTTETGGTKDSPDFNFTAMDGGPFLGSTRSVLAAEVLNLALQVAALKDALAAEKRSAR